MSEYYYICKNCEARLDPNEHCDCDTEYKKYKETIKEMVKIPKKGGQIKFKFSNNPCEGR